MSAVLDTTSSADELVAAYPRRKQALIILFLASFMDLLDTTIVNVALPPLQRELHASYSAVQWVIAGYAMSFALLLITGGRLGDIVGRKRMFLIGVAGFTLASALCGAAQNPEMLITARVIQGVGSALMIPQVLSCIQVMFAPKERGAAVGMFGALAGVATVAGPIFGALLTEGDLFGLGWRAIFWINVPVGIVTYVMASAVVPESRSPHALRLDLVGVVLTTGGMFLLIYPLIQGRDAGWPAWTFVMMAAALPVFLLFLWYERRKTARDGSPLVVLKLFRNRTYSAGLTVSLIFMSAMGGYFLVQTLYLQQGLGMSVLRAGLTGIPFSISTSFCAGMGAAVLVPKFGRRVVSAGALLLIAGFAILMWTFSHYGTALASWQIGPGLIVAGAGFGLIVAPLFDFVLADVPVEDAGSASGVVEAVQQVAFAVGVALVGVLFFNLVGTGNPAGFTHGMVWTLWAGIAAVTVVFAVTFLLPRQVAHHLDEA